MAQETRITSADFFWNAAAQEAGFSGQFWLDAYNCYLDAVQRDPLTYGKLSARSGFPQRAATLTYWSGFSRKGGSTAPCASPCSRTATGLIPVSWTVGTSMERRRKKRLPYWEKVPCWII